MVPEHELFGIRIQIDLTAYVADIKDLDIVSDQRSHAQPIVDGNSLRTTFPKALVPDSSRE
jgi:hypothetical protein